MSCARTPSDEWTASHPESLSGFSFIRSTAKTLLAVGARHGFSSALVILRSNTGRPFRPEVQQVIADSLRAGDVTERTAPGEISCFLSDVMSTDAARMVAIRLCHVVRAQAFGGVSCGVAFAPLDGATYDELRESAEHDLGLAPETCGIPRADIAPYHWSTENTDVVLHYQPIFTASGRRIAGWEGLARTAASRAATAAPGHLLDAAESDGRICHMDHWSLVTAALQASAWDVAGEGAWVGVNVSARTLNNPDLPAFVTRLMDQHALHPGSLLIEVTETSAMRNPARTANVIRDLRSRGCRIAIDDFGTGHSCMSYLRDFPVDLIKLDKSFTAGIGQKGYEERLIETMTTLAHSIGAEVAAEGVETTEQLAWLRTSGCDYVQGYLLGKPAAPQLPTEVEAVA